MKVKIVCNNPVAAADPQVQEWLASVEKTLQAAIDDMERDLACFGRCVVPMDADLTRWEDV